MPFTPQQAIDLFEAGFGTAEVVKRGIQTIAGDPASPRTARRWRRYWLDGVADPHSHEPGFEVEVNESEIEIITRLCLNKFVPLKELSESLDRSETSVRHIIETMAAMGVNVEVSESTAHFSSKRSVLPIDAIKDPLATSMTMKFAVASDWHTGSIYEQRTHRFCFYHYAHRLGYNKMLVPGDLSEGLDMRQGHELGMYVHTVDALDSLLDEDFKLLKELGFDVYVIGGNHDSPIIKKHKTDLVWRACKRWDNVKFLGYDKYDLPITDRVSLRLWHPDGGAGANPTGRIEKAIRGLHIEEMIQELSDEGVTDSNVKGVIGGHFHIYSTLQYGSRFGLLVPSFQGQTDYLDRKPLIGMTGGVFLDITLGDNGDVLEWGSRLRAYRPIREDYKRYELPVCSVPDNVTVLVCVKEPLLEKLAA